MITRFKAINNTFKNIQSNLWLPFLLSMTSVLRICLDDVMVQPGVGGVNDKCIGDLEAIA